MQVASTQCIGLIKPPYGANRWRLSATVASQRGAAHGRRSAHSKGCPQGGRRHTLSENLMMDLAYENAYDNSSEDSIQCDDSDGPPKEMYN